jgi:hypothetical protein
MGGIIQRKRKWRITVVNRISVGTRRPKAKRAKFDQLMDKTAMGSTDQRRGPRSRLPVNSMFSGG